MHIVKCIKDLEQLDGNMSLNSTVVKDLKQEMPAKPILTEDILTLKLDLEYWTWPEVKPHHQKSTTLKRALEHHRTSTRMHWDLTQATSLKLES